MSLYHNIANILKVYTIALAVFILLPKEVITFILKFNIIKLEYIILKL